MRTLRTTPTPTTSPSSPLGQDINDRISGYRDLVEALATKVARTRRALRSGADYEDLVQEGLINVWQTLERGIEPSADIIQFRMLDYVRWLERQTGLPPCTEDPETGELDCPQHVPYEALLPLDDFRGTGATEL